MSSVHNSPDMLSLIYIYNLLSYGCTPSVSEYKAYSLFFLVPQYKVGYLYAHVHRFIGIERFNCISYL
jgi:hypothetical protein